MKAFGYERAGSVTDALSLAAQPHAAFLAGGTNLVDLMKLRVAEPELLVDVTAVLDTEIVQSVDGGLRIGAGVRNSDLAANADVRRHYPVLAEAVLAGASGQLRNMATVGGNLLQRTRCSYFQDVSKPCNKRTPGSGCPARSGEHRNLAVLGASEHCIATHPSDMAVALTALDAVVHVETAGGAQRIPLTELYRSPGDQPQHDTVLPHGALVTAVEIPPLSGRSQYRKVRERASYAFAIASVAGVLELHGNRIANVRLAFGAVAPMPWRARLAEEALRGQVADERTFRHAVDRELGAAQPLRDNAYKIEMISSIAVRTLTELAAQAMTAIGAVGVATHRIDAIAKVTGQAQYSAEIPFDERAYGAIVQSPVARGRVTAIDSAAVLAMPGVLSVLTHENAPRLQEVADRETMLLQSDAVQYRGEIVALVVAASLEQARAGAEALEVSCVAQPHDVTWDTEHPGLFTPEKVNPNFPAETHTGDVDRALTVAANVVDQTYSTPAEHNNPMEPHAATAVWDGMQLTVYDSNQGAASVRQAMAELFGLDTGQVRILSEHVGGGFGAKGSLRPPAVLAPMAARAVARPVTVALSRQEMFALVGYRTPTVQRIRLAADAAGQLTAVDHLAYSQTSHVLEFAEQTAVISRLMYATPNVRTAHRLVALDVPTPRWMRAPGEAPGSFALESAMDELADAAGIDPVELRIRNDARREPEGGLEFTSRSLVECLREGARRFGWAEREPRPGVRRDGRWLIGSGVASSTYPARSSRSTAKAIAHPDGTFTIEITASDIGTGARTALTAVAADELRVSPDRVAVHIGDSDYGQAMIAGGSMGTASWAWAIAKPAANCATSSWEHPTARWPSAPTLPTTSKPSSSTHGTPSAHSSPR